VIEKLLYCYFQEVLRIVFVLIVAFSEFDFTVMIEPQNTAKKAERTRVREHFEPF